MAGTIPLRKPTTRKSPRALKLKEPDVGEGSSLVAEKQLEFDPKPVPIIKTSTKEVFIHPLTFGDIEASIGTKLVLPHWEERFQNIKQEEFPECTPHSYLDMRKLDDEVFLNI